LTLRRILVTGGAGFIGGAVVRRLVGRGHHIVNLDKLTYSGNLDSLQSVADAPNYRFVQADIADHDRVSSLLTEERIDSIMHLAAESHVDRSIDGPGIFVETNVTGTFKLLNAALGYWRTLEGAARENFRFHQISTDEVFGDLPFDSGIFTEETAFAPNSPYSASKAASDHLVRAFHHTYGLPVLTTNCSNNYGPYQFPEKLIPLVIAKALAGESIPVYGDGLNVRDWLYVGDHCTAIRRVLDSGRVGETYNVGGDAERDNLTVVKAICDLLDARQPLADGRPRTALISHVRDRPGHDRRYAIDASKLQGELGWAPSVTFEEGMARTVAWYLDHQPWVTRVLDGSYRLERIGQAD